MLKSVLIVTFPLLARLYSNIINHLLIRFRVLPDNHRFGTKKQQVMRKLSVVLVAAMLLSAGNLVANDVTTVDPLKSLSAQIGNLLKDNNFNRDAAELTAQVRFTLNDQHEIVVLSVDTDDSVLERFVKSRLNYRKVELDTYKEGKLYTIPVRIVS